MGLDYESLRAKSQQALVEFLRAELALGSTFVQSALLSQQDGHTDHYDQAKSSAVKAAKSIRQFMTRVEDGRIRAELQNQVEELDRLLSTL
jgi:hypothetical protein